jgi:PAS domain S-box-containing protein
MIYFPALFVSRPSYYLCIYVMMNYKGKTKDGLVKELQKLKQKYDSLKISYEKDTSGYKKMELELRKSENKYRTVADFTYDWEYWEGTDNQILYMSPSCERISGYKPDEFISDSFLLKKIIHPDDLKLFDDHFGKIHSSEYISDIGELDFKILKKDDSVVHIGHICRPVIDDKGNYLGRRISNSDITKHKQAEEFLEKYKNFISSTPDGIAYLDENYRYIIVNEAYEKFSGISREHFIGLTVAEFLGEDIFQRIIKPHFDRCLRGEVINYQEWFIYPTIGRRFLDINYFPYKDTGNHIVGVINVGRDITERKQVEEALQMEIENFRHSLEDSPLGVRIATIDGSTIYANKTLLNFYGYDDLEELQKTPLKNRYTPESYLQAQIRKRQRDSGDLSTADYEISIIRKNGEIRHLQAFRKKVLWDSGSHFQIIYIDITDRKLAENEVIKSKKQLEELHFHLNDILENERAMISREIHDQIGQSLTALKLDLNWMHKYLGIYPEAVAKLDGMIALATSIIKDVQRISSNLRPGIIDDLGLAAAIEWYSEEFENRTGIKCKLKLDDSFDGDPQKDLILFRVLQESLTNVIRHANASVVTIELNQTQKGMTLIIRDNGIGIKREEVESTKSLGLLGMRERVRQFGGKIVFSSKEGSGTKITIFIPDNHAKIL